MGLWLYKKVGASLVNSLSLYGASFLFLSLSLMASFSCDTSNIHSSRPYCPSSYKMEHVAA
jgi:hypothetical protein